MRFLKPAKIFLILAVLLFVAKPFLGFSLFNPSHKPVKASILVKSFTKRKLEYSENGEFDMASVQEKLANPVHVLVITFSFLLCIIFPAVFVNSLNTSNRFLRGLLLGIPFSPKAYLLNGSLQI